MEEKESRISKLFNEYLRKMDTIKGDEDASEFYGELTRGKTSYMKLNRLATSYFDMTWINAIEDVIFDLGDIIKNPREVTKTEAVLVPVELARKTSSESVRHLASHTQYIKTINEDGDVIPNKVITMANEEDIHTYENRFIATLIRRLVLFIEKRYEFIQSFPPFSDEQILYFKNDSIVNGAHVEIETKIKIQSESDTSLAEISDKYIERIKDIREYVLYYYSSQFMRTMKTDKDVRNPIILTNILRKNPKYRKCYELYRFIERYQQLGVSYKVDENVAMLDKAEIDELNTVMFTNYLAAQDHERTKKLKTTSRTYKPKILTSIDDEQFVYGELLKGPIDFVRVDEPYQEYLDSKIKKDLPLHPTKAEREYYEEEYKARKIRKEDKEQLEKLKKRKSKEALENEKRIREIIAEREREEELRRQAEEAAARAAEEARIDEIRRQIIAAANEEAAKESEEEIGENPIAEIPESESTTIGDFDHIDDSGDRPTHRDIFADISIDEAEVEERVNEIFKSLGYEEESEEESIEDYDFIAEIAKQVEEENKPEPEPEPEPEVKKPKKAKKPKEEPVPEEAPVEETPAEPEEEEPKVVIPKKEKRDDDASRFVKIGGSKRKKKDQPEEETPSEEPVEEATPTEEAPVTEEPVSEAPVEEVPAESEEPAVVIPKKKKTDGDPTRYVKIGGSKRRKKGQPELEAASEEPAPVEEAPAEEPVVEAEPAAEAPAAPKKKKSDGDPTRYVKIGGSKRKKKGQPVEAPVEEVPVEEAPVEEVAPVEEAPAAPTKPKKKQSSGEPSRYVKIGGSKRKNREKAPKPKKKAKVSVINKTNKPTNDDALRYVKIGGSKRKNRGEKPAPKKKKPKVAVINKRSSGEPSRYVKIGGSKRRKKK